MNLRAALKSHHPYAIAALIAAIIVTDAFSTSTRRMFISHPSRDTSHSFPFDNIKPDTQLLKRKPTAMVHLHLCAPIAMIHGVEKILTAIDLFFSFWTESLTIENLIIESLVIEIFRQFLYEINYLFNFINSVKLMKNIVFI